MLNGISAVVEVIAILLFVNYMYGRRIRWNVLDAVFLVLQTVIVEYANYFDTKREIIIFTYLIIVAYQFLKFKASTNKICVNTVELVCVFVVLQVVCIVPFLWVERMASTDILVISTNICLLILICLLGRCGILEKISGYIMRHEWFIKISAFCCFFGSVYILIIYKFEQYLRYTDFFIFGVWSVLIFVMVINWQKAKEMYHTKAKELEMERVYDQYAEELLRSVVRKQHDFDNYIQALLGQIQTATTLDELVYEQKRFITDIRNDNHFNKLLAGGNSLLIGFLYSKFSSAESADCNIIYQVKTQDMKCIVPLYKIIEMIGILLDNAIEAVFSQMQKDIFVTIVEDDKGILIRISNIHEYVPQNIIHDWLQENYSSKAENRGIGLANVVRVVEEYGIDFAVYNEAKDSINCLVFELQIKK